MRWHKKIIKHPKFQAFVSWIAAWYIGFVYKTTIWQKDLKSFAMLHQQAQPFIVVFWHNRLLLTVFAWDQQPKEFHMLISGHSDGRIIADTVAYYGIKTVSGSSSKGGVQAVRELLKVLKSGHTIGITPDGPRGPRLVVSDGVIQLAKLSECPIVPLAFSLKRRIVLNSWDRFILALPFNRGTMIAGEPIIVSRDADVTQQKLLVQKALRDVTDQADALCDHGVLR